MTKKSEEEMVCRISARTFDTRTYGDEYRVVSVSGEIPKEFHRQIITAYTLLTKDEIKSLKKLNCEVVIDEDLK